MTTEQTRILYRYLKWKFDQFEVKPFVWNIYTTHWTIGKETYFSYVNKNYYVYVSFGNEIRGYFPFTCGSENLASIVINFYNNHYNDQRTSNK